MSKKTDGSELEKRIGMIEMAFLSVAALYPMAMGVSNAAAAVSYAGFAAPLIPILGALLILFTSIPILEYARLTAFAGGYYGLVELGFGKAVGKFTALLNLFYFITFDVLTASAYSFIIYTSFYYMAHIIVPSYVFVLISVLVLAGMYIINTLALTLSTKVIIFSGIIQMIIMIIYAIIVIIKSPYNSLQAFNPSVAPGGLSGVMLGVILAGFLFYTGYGAPLFFAEEGKAPFKDVWRAILLGTSLPTLVGIIAMYSEVIAVGLPHASSLANDWNPAVVAYLPYVGLGGAIIYIIIALLGQAFGAFVPGMSAARLIYALARDGFINSTWLTKVHPKYKTPSNAGLLNLIIGTIATISVELLMFYTYGYQMGVFYSVFLAGSMTVAYWYFHHVIPDISLVFLYKRLGIPIKTLRNLIISIVAPIGSAIVFVYSFYLGYSSLTEPYFGGFLFVMISAVAAAIYIAYRRSKKTLGMSVVSEKINIEILKKTITKKS